LDRCFRVVTKASVNHEVRIITDPLSCRPDERKVEFFILTQWPQPNFTAVKPRSINRLPRFRVLGPMIATVALGTTAPV
jgi:hypothetical protein